MSLLLLFDFSGVYRRLDLCTTTTVWGLTGVYHSILPQDNTNSTGQHKLNDIC